MTLPSLYRRLLGEGFFTFDDARALVGDRNSTRTGLQRLVRGRYIKPVKRGLYQLVLPEYLGRQAQQPFDKFLLGRKLASRYFFSHHSALELHGVANSATFSTVYVASPRQLRALSYRGVDYVWVRKTKLYGIEKMVWSDKEVVVSDREKTIIDCLDRVDLGGGLEEAFKSVTSFPTVDKEKLLSYLKMSGKKSLVRRLGFLLSRKEVRTRWGIDDTLLRRLGRQVSDKVYYFATGTREGKLVREWNLIVPRNLEAVVTSG
jgi:predicted transcriptional regulator of viral defense system